MGKFRKGILGPFSGKVGTVVGGNWKGTAYMRSIPGKRTGSTQKQKEHNAKFAAVMECLKNMTPVIKMGFESGAKESGFNRAFSYNLKNAVTGAYPAFTVNYSMLLVSRGDLPNADEAKATLTDGNVYFTWVDNSGLGMAKATDKSILLAYCPALKIALYNLNGNARGTQSAMLNTGVFKNHEVQVYLGFTSEDETEVSNSIYLGALGHGVQAASGV